MHLPVGAAETLARVLLLLLLIWLPLPFGSVTRHGEVALALGSLSIFVLAAAPAVAKHQQIPVTRSFVLWTASGVLLVAVAALQLLPLPPGIVAALSPAAHDIWLGAKRVHESLAGPTGFRGSFPLSVSPPDTAAHLLRVMSYLAIFQSAALLIRRRPHRVLVAVALCLAALVEVLFGLQQLYREELTIWGWENTKIFNRVTGTYVNPNHYAHYLALVFPVALYLGIGSLGGERAGGRAEGTRRFLERGLLRMVAGLGTALACLAGILIAQSRGALASLVAAMVIVSFVMAMDRLLRSRRKRGAHLATPIAASALLILLLGAFVAYFGVRQTVGRFEPLPGERATLVGRTIGMRAAVDVWRLFPLFGSGLGTFEYVVMMRQPAELGRVFTHAHNDYLEILATTGLAGALVVIGALSAMFLLWCDAFRRGASLSMSVDRRRFLTASLVVFSTVALHALFDFNFFIPANAATAACLAGIASTLGYREENEHRPNRTDP